VTVSVPSLSLADEFWLLGHDEVSGRAHVSRRVLYLGVGGALLGELVLADRLTVTDGLVSVVDGGDQGDAATGTALRVIGHNQRAGALHPARTWVEYLGGQFGERTYAAVTRRLEIARLVKPIRTGGLLRASRFVAADQQVGMRPRIGLSWAIERRTWPGQQAATLAGLVLAVGLAGMVRPYEHSHVLDEGLRWLSGQLPPELGAVVAGVEAAVSALAGAARR